MSATGRNWDAEDDVESVQPPNPGEEHQHSELRDDGELTERSGHTCYI